MCDNMLEDILQDTEGRMNKTLSAFNTELTKIRTGRATSALVDHIIVDYYGVETPINQLASVSIPVSICIFEGKKVISSIPSDSLRYCRFRPRLSYASVWQ